MIVQGQAFPTDKHAHIQGLLGFYAAPPVSTIDQTQEQSCTFVLGCLFPFVLDSTICLWVQRSPIVLSRRESVDSVASPTLDLWNLVWLSFLTRKLDRIRLRWFWIRCELTYDKEDNENISEKWSRVFPVRTWLSSSSSSSPRSHEMGISQKWYIGSIAKIFFAIIFAIIIIEWWLLSQFVPVPQSQNCCIWPSQNANTTLSLLNHSIYHITILSRYHLIILVSLLSS